MNLIFTFLSFFCIPLSANITLDFSHSNMTTGASQNTGRITLDFTVDSSGGVELVALSNASGPASYVNGFNGNVGTLTDEAMWSTTFQVTIDSDGTGSLRVDNGGHGLSIQGQNSQRIDAAIEGVRITSQSESIILSLLEIGYRNATTSTGSALSIDTTDYSITASSGTIDVSAQGISENFLISSNSDTDDQGFVLSSIEFDIQAVIPPPTLSFDNDNSDGRWKTATNWSGDTVPTTGEAALIDGFDVVLTTFEARNPDLLKIDDGSLTLSETAHLSAKTAEIGTEITGITVLNLNGSSASLNASGSSTSDDEFLIGSTATITTKPDNSGTSKLELRVANLTLEKGAVWFLDGQDYTGTYNIGDQFVLANYGSFSGSTLGISFGNFNLPPERDLRLVENGTSLYFEVVAQPSASGPNIIVVYLDDIAGGYYFGFEKETNAHTPTLDNMADTGLVFTNATTSSTVCSPSRYTLLTGRFPSRNTSAHYRSGLPDNSLARFQNNNIELEDDRQNIGAWMQQLGYRTGFVGKSHILDHDVGNTGKWSSLGLLTYSSTADPKTNPEVNGAMRHNHRVISQRLRNYGFDYVDGFYKANTKEFFNSYLDNHHQEFITEHALEFIDQNHSQRFFLHVGPTIDHGPIRDDLSRSLRVDINYTPEGYRPGVDYSFMPTREDIIREAVTDEGFSESSARMTWIDYSVKAIRARLQDYGIADDTLIVFTSDHGGVLNLPDISSAKVNGKTTCYDLGMKVPLLYHWPNGITSPTRTNDELVSNEDFVPTCLDLAGGLDLPTRPLDGMSIKPYLEGVMTPLRDDVYCEIGYSRGVRTKTTKYIALRYDPDVYQQISNGDKWTDYSTGLDTLDRPYHVGNGNLGHSAQVGFPSYFEPDQFFNLVTDAFEQTNSYGNYPKESYTLKKRLSEYTSLTHKTFRESITSVPSKHPFREFDSTDSTEFAPRPTAVPTAPSDLSIQFLTANQIKLDWTDGANTELGYIVEKSVNSGAYEIIAETPTGVTTSTVDIDSGIEDIILRVSSYNLEGDSAATKDMDMLSAENWRTRTFVGTDPDLGDPDSQWLADPDQDGSETIWEYFQATNALSSDTKATFDSKITTDAGKRYLEIRVPRGQRRLAEVYGSTSTDLENWSDGEPNVTITENSPTQMIFRSSTAIEDSTSKKQFLRAVIQEP